MRSILCAVAATSGQRRGFSPSTSRLEAWFEMNVPDTDIHVTLYEILADGSSVSLTSEMQRARYLTSLEHETPGHSKDYPSRLILPVVSGP